MDLAETAGVEDPIYVAELEVIDEQGDDGMGNLLVAHHLLVDPRSLLLQKRGETIDECVSEVPGWHLFRHMQGKNFFCLPDKDLAISAAAEERHGGEMALLCGEKVLVAQEGIMEELGCAMMAFLTWSTVAVDCTIGSSFLYLIIT